MKNILLISGILLISLSSCKKDYVCECTTVDKDEIIDDQIKSITLNGKKDDVEAACTKMNDRVLDIVTTCIVK